MPQGPRQSPVLLPSWQSTSKCKEGAALSTFWFPSTLTYEKETSQRVAVAADFADVHLRVTYSKLFVATYTQHG
jgi:hypothetical protein